MQLSSSILICAAIACVSLSLRTNGTCAEQKRAVLTFSDAVTRALDKNPRLASFDPAMRAADGRILQAGLRPNPEVGLDVEDFLGSGPFSDFDAAQTTLFLSQLIERGGKRKARRTAEMRAKDTLYMDYEAVRRGVFAEVIGAYVDVLAAQDLIALYQDFVTLNESFLPIIQKRIDAGRAPTVEVTRGKLAVGSARLQLDQAGRALEVARVFLATSWGATSADFDKVSGTLAELPDVDSQQELLSRVEGHPEVARFIAERKQREAELKLAVANGKQDVTVGVGPRQFSEGSGETSIVLAFSIPFPIFNRNQGAIREARENVRIAEKEREAALLSVTSRFLGAYLQLRAAREGVAMLSEEILPGTEEAFDQVNEGYNQGRFGYLDVIDARRNLVTAREQLLNFRRDYHRAAARVSGLTSSVPTGPDFPQAQTENPNNSTQSQ